MYFSSINNTYNLCDVRVVVLLSAQQQDAVQLKHFISPGVGVGCTNSYGVACVFLVCLGKRITGCQLRRTLTKHEFFTKSILRPDC